MRAGCDAYFADSVGVDGAEVRVYRCDWGWYVKRGDAEGVRSRYLDDAMERALGRRLDRRALAAVLGALEHELTTARDRTGRTASRTITL